MSDLISRQEAISEIVGMTTMGVEELVNAGDKEKFDWIKGLSDSLVKIINLPSAQPEIIRCKDCKHFHYDMPYVIQGIPILGHEVCDFWGDGCKTDENGFCSYAERRTDADTEV